MSLIRLAIGEGKYDQLFIYEFVHHYLKVGDRVYLLPTTYQNHHRNFKKLQHKLSNPKERMFLLDKVIIVGDNGKSNLIRKFIPRLFVDYITKMKMKILVVVDQDNEDPNEIFRRISKEVKDRLNPNLAEHSEVQDKSLIVVRSTSRPLDFYVECRVFVMPESLERQIALVAYQKFDKETKNLYNLNPHDAIREIAEELNLSEEQLIRKVVENTWLDNQKEWLIELIEIFNNYLLN